MKKLMVMLAAIAMVGAAQAAAMDWSVAGVSAPCEGATVYLLTGVKASTYTSQLGTALQSAAVETLLSNLASDAASSLVVDSSGGKTGGNVDLSTLGLVDAESTFYEYNTVAQLIAISADKTQFMASDGYQGDYFAVADREDNVKFYESREFYFYGKSWSNVSTAVPEPTSGLLLLVGGALLALRRRRV